MPNNIPAPATSQLIPFFAITRICGAPHTLIWLSAFLIHFPVLACICLYPTSHSATPPAGRKNGLSQRKGPSKPEFGGSSGCTEYLPGGRLGASYTPFASLTATISPAGPVILTLIPACLAATFQSTS